MKALKAELARLRERDARVRAVLGNPGIDRQTAINRALELLKETHKRPMLGYGFGGFWDEKNTLKYSEMLHWHIPHGHNAYLDTVLSTGLVGLVLYLLWLLATMVVCVSRYERTGRAGLLFALCLCVFAIVHGISESKFPGTGLGGTALLTAMMMIAVERPQQSLSSIASR
jgi:O-antigen ligase